MYSPFCRMARSSVSRGSQRSIGFCLCLLRMLARGQQGARGGASRRGRQGVPRVRAGLDQQRHDGGAERLLGARQGDGLVQRRVALERVDGVDLEALLVEQLVEHVVCARQRGARGGGGGGRARAHEPYCAATCSAVLPSASAAPLRNAGAACAASTSASRSVLSRRAASSSSSAAEAPCERQRGRGRRGRRAHTSSSAGAGGAGAVDMVGAGGGWLLGGDGGGDRSG